MSERPDRPPPGVPRLSVPTPLAFVAADNAPVVSSPSPGRRPVPPPPANAGASPRPPGTRTSLTTAPAFESPREEDFVSPLSPTPARSSAAFARVQRPPARAPGSPLPPPPPGVVRALPPKPPSVGDSAAVSDSKPAGSEKAALSEEEMARKRAQVCREVLDTEERYLAQLQLIANEYEKKLLEMHVLTPLADKAIFINIVSLAQLHEQLLDSLRHNDVGHALCQITPALTLYVEYVNKFNEASVTLRRLVAENKKFARALDKCKHANLGG
jgi:hypothetical protein